jgi:cytochrome c biogenesis protein CcdA
MRGYVEIEELCRLAGAQQMSSMQIVELLGAFAQGDRFSYVVFSCLEPILMLPAVAAASSGALVEFLEALIQQEPCSGCGLRYNAHTNATVYTIE